MLVGSLGGALFGCNPDLLEGDECNDGNLALPFSGNVSLEDVEYAQMIDCGIIWAWMFAFWRLCHLNKDLVSLRGL